MTPKTLTRRQFLKTSASAAMAGALFLGAPGSRPVFGKDKTRVVLIRDEAATDDLNRPDIDVLAGMLDKAVVQLTGADGADAAWKQLFEPEDVVGIKSNVWRYLRTPEGLESAIEQRLIATGVEQKNISTDDRGIGGNPVFRKATALINIRPMRTHHWSGVGSLIKNYIMFVNQPSDYHPDSCADLAKIWFLPGVEGKTRLNVLLMLTPLFHGVGPHHYNPKYIWRYNGLLAGFDPVAVDATGVRILTAKRNQFFGEERPINPPPKHIFLADTRHRLGTADPDRIELVQLGWDKDLLI
jgi:hypothetical protein